MKQDLLFAISPQTPVALTTRALKSGPEILSPLGLRPKDMVLGGRATGKQKEKSSRGCLFIYTYLVRNRGFLPKSIFLHERDFDPYYMYMLGEMPQIFG